MRDTADYRAEGGSTTVRLRHGFTLVEVAVATAILIVLLVGLMGSYAASVVRMKQAQQMTFAQNLAEFTVEDIKAMSPGVLRTVAENADTNPNYVGAKERLLSDPLYDATAAARDGPLWIYDSGLVATDFLVTGVTALPGGLSAGGASVPPLPTSSSLLLGDNTTVGTISIPDPVSGGNLWYYTITFHHSDYKLLKKEVEITMYDGSMNTAVYSPWASTTPSMYRVYSGDSTMVFAYRVTVFQGDTASPKAIYKAEGTIAFPYS